MVVDLTVDEGQVRHLAVIKCLHRGTMYYEAWLHHQQDIRVRGFGIELTKESLREKISRLNTPAPISHTHDIWEALGTEGEDVMVFFIMRRQDQHREFSFSFPRYFDQFLGLRGSSPELPGPGDEPTPILDPPREPGLISRQSPGTGDEPPPLLDPSREWELGWLATMDQFHHSALASAFATQGVALVSGAESQTPLYHKYLDSFSAGCAALFGNFTSIPRP